MMGNTYQQIYKKSAKEYYRQVKIEKILNPFFRYFFFYVMRCSFLSGLTLFSY
jgi:hypothetical protein